MDMRIRLFLLAFLLIGYTSYAQNSPEKVKTVVEWNGIHIPADAVLGVTIIAEKATLGGLSYVDRVAVDPELDVDFDVLVNRCADGANKLFMRYSQSIYFTPRTEGRQYLITYIVRSVSTQGYAISDVTIDTPTGEKAVILGLKGEGGRYGSFFNLMGDGMESLGSELAKLIVKAVNLHKI